MSVIQVLLILVCVIGIAVGQVLFKFAAIDFMGLNLREMLCRSVFNYYLLSGLIVYALSTVLWVWVLRTTALNHAYPFMALAFVMVPLSGRFFFRETLGAGYVLGMVLVVSGLLIVWASGKG